MRMRRTRVLNSIEYNDNRDVLFDFSPSDLLRPDINQAFLSLHKNEHTCVIRPILALNDKAWWWKKTNNSFIMLSFEIFTKNNLSSYTYPGVLATLKGNDLHKFRYDPLHMASILINSKNFKPPKPGAKYYSDCCLVDEEAFYNKRTIQEDDIKFFYKTFYDIKNSL